MGAARASRLSQRGDHRERRWDTLAGRIDLCSPKLRNGSSFPSFLEPRRTAEEGLTAMIQQAYISTRARRQPR